MKTILITSFVLICSVAFAQQHATQNTQCQMTMEEILRAQSFDIDEPESEEAREVFRSLYEDLNAIYQSAENSADREDYKEELKITIDKAKELDLNITMFEEDIDNIFK